MSKSTHHNVHFTPSYSNIWIVGLQNKMVQKCNHLLNIKSKTMVDIIHRIGIKTGSDKVFKALSTIEGLSNWWTKGRKNQVHIPC
jgi:hypothetical protein